MRGAGGARLVAFACVAALTLGGCAGKRAAGPTVDVSTPAPAYEEVAARYNQRADRLGRVWATAVARLDFVDAEGKMRREQGEGHLQFIAPSRLALSLGKLSETLFWVGCDAERFWSFELQDDGVVSVGRHENIGSPCAEPLGLPAQPLEIIQLLGVTPLPDAASAPEASTSWSRDGRWLVVRAPGRAGAMQLHLDPESLEPSWIGVLRADGAGVAVQAELTEYAPVMLEGTPHFPRMASRITISAPGDDGSIRLTLASLSDGTERSGRLAPRVFEFESLAKALRPGRIIVLDEACERPAVGSPGGG